MRKKYIAIECENSKYCKNYIKNDIKITAAVILFKISAAVICCIFV